MSDLWHLIGFLIQSALAACLSLLAFFGLAPTKLGEKFLDHYFASKLATVKHDYDQQIEALKAALKHLEDRGVRSNEKEFNATIAVWESFLDAYGTTCRCAASYIRHPDLSHMPDDDVRSFLNSTTLPERHKKEIASADSKNRAYSNFVSLGYIADAQAAIFNARSVLQKQSIFIADDLSLSFKKALELLLDAYAERAVDPYCNDVGKGVTTLLSKGESVVAALLTDVRTRVFRV
jgi:hypothetical protein